MEDKATITKESEQKTETVNQEVQPSEFEKQKKPFSLHDRLSKATEHKTFSAPAPEPEKPKETSKQNSLGLGSDDDFEEKKTETKKPDSGSAGKKEEGPITEKTKRASARTAVGMLDLTQRGIFQPLQTWKFKRKFTNEEIEKIDLIEDKEDAKLEEKEIALKKKWNRLLKKYNKKYEDVPMKEKEKQDLEEAFYNYFDYKEKTLSPEWFIGMAVVNSIGGRAIDLITD